MATKKQKFITQDSAKNIILGTNAKEVYSYQNNNSASITKRKDNAGKSTSNSIDKFDSNQKNNNYFSSKEQDNSGMTVFLFDFQRNLSNIETKQTILQNDLNTIKMTLNKHEQEIYSHDTIHRIKQLDTKIKNAQVQISDLTKIFDKEMIEKGKINAMHVEAYNKLQDHINNQLTLDKNTLNNILSDIQRETNGLKNQLIQIEKDVKNDIKKVDKTLNDFEINTKNLNKEYKSNISKNIDEIKNLKIEVVNTSNTLRNKFNSQLEKLVNEFNVNEKNSKMYVEEKNQSITAKIENNFNLVNNSINDVKNNVNKNVNELLALYQQTDDKVEKIDKTVQKIEKSYLKATKESQTQSITAKRHEEGFLKKLTLLESQLQEYIDNTNKKMQQLENNVEQKLTRQKSSDSLKSTNTFSTTSLATINTPEKIKEELLAIMNEKEKLSYNGSLLAEEKILNIQRQLENFKNDFDAKSKEFPTDKTINQIKKQMSTLENLMDHVQEAQKILNQKIDQEIPQNMNELDIKTKNSLKALDNKYSHEINLLQSSLVDMKKSKKQASKEIEENNKKRLRHEELLMKKLLKLEDDVNSFMSTKMKEIEEIEKKLEDNKNPSRLNSKHSRTTETPANKDIDIEKIRAELTSIVSEKSKLTYQSTLIVEEKVLVLQGRLNNFKKELDNKLHLRNLDDPRLIELQKQMASVKTMISDMEKAQQEIKEKLDEEVPESIEEMSKKMKNALNLIGQRITQEEEERYLAINELQEVCEGLIVKYKSINYESDKKKPIEKQNQMKEMQAEINECKNAIKKLAETLSVFKKNIEDEFNKKKKFFN